jgi:hypothetical protein
MLNAAPLQGIGEQRVLRCHSSRGISLRGIVAIHIGFLLFLLLLLIAALSWAEGLGPMVRATVMTLPIPMFPQRELSTMRRLPHLRQLRQIRVSDSHSS